MFVNSGMMFSSCANLLIIGNCGRPHDLTIFRIRNARAAVLLGDSDSAASAPGLGLLSDPYFIYVMFSSASSGRANCSARPIPLSGMLRSGTTDRDPDQSALNSVSVPTDESPKSVGPVSSLANQRAAVSQPAQQNVLTVV